MVADDSRAPCPREFDERDPAIVESADTDTDQIGWIVVRQLLDDLPAFGGKSTG